MNFLNHLMNGCDKKDVTSFSKQNNNFIEVVGFTIYFKMFIMHHSILYHFTVLLTYSNFLNLRRIKVLWSNEELLKQQHMSSATEMWQKICRNKILTSSTARLFLTICIPSSLFTGLVNIIFKIFCKGK